MNPGGASITSLEHDPAWFELVRRELRRFGLEANVALILECDRTLEIARAKHVTIYGYAEIDG